jgi:hypothetical protein
MARQGWAVGVAMDEFVVAWADGAFTRQFGRGTRRFTTVWCMQGGG